MPLFLPFLTPCSISAPLSHNRSRTYAQNSVTNRYNSLLQCELNNSPALRSLHCGQFRRQWWAAYSGTLAALIHLRGVRFLTDKKLETSGGIVTPRRNCPQTPWDSLRSLLADSVPGRAWGCRQK